MKDPSEIDRRVQGTPYASTISRNSPQQRDGVLGTMNLVADTVRLLKSEQEAKRHWTAREWVKKRQGWIFLTSTPETREALKPLISLWLDLLILRLLTEPGEGARRVWFLLDELGSLQKLPQLVTAVTENRKSNNPVVMGIQGKAQLETIYGHIAETMLSMPWTALFFKTTEPGAAEWISRYLGVQEIERLAREPDNWLRNDRFSAQPRIEDVRAGDAQPVRGAGIGGERVGCAQRLSEIRQLHRAADHRLLGPAEEARGVHAARACADVSGAASSRQRMRRPNGGQARKLEQKREQGQPGQARGSSTEVNYADHLKTAERGPGRGVSRQRIYQRRAELLHAIGHRSGASGRASSPRNGISRAK